MKLVPNIIVRKIATGALITASLAAFANLGDGGKRSFTHHKNLLTDHSVSYNFKTFSLKSGYSYRGDNIFAMPKCDSRFIMLNTVVTYQKGNTTYILPLKKKVLLDKINFHPEQPIR